MIKSKNERENFGFKRSTSLNDIDILGFVSIGKQLNLDRKLIRFVVLLLLLFILMPSTSFVILIKYFYYLQSSYIILNHTFLINRCYRHIFNDNLSKNSCFG